MLAGELRKWGVVDNRLVSLLVPFQNIGLT